MGLPANPPTRARRPNPAQLAAREDSRESYKKFAALTNELNKGINLRGLLRFKTAGRTPVPLDEARSAQPPRSALRPPLRSAQH